jgi:hypothetical protein
MCPIGESAIRGRESGDGVFVPFDAIAGFLEGRDVAVDCSQRRFDHAVGEAIELEAVRSVWNSDDCSLIPAFAYATAGPAALGHHQRVGVGSSKRS